MVSGILHAHLYIDSMHLFNLHIYIQTVCLSYTVEHINSKSFTMFYLSHIHYASNYTQTIFSLREKLAVEVYIGSANMMIQTCLHSSFLKMG